MNPRTFGLIAVIFILAVLLAYMFNPFKKTYTAISEYPDTWSLLKGADQGKPMFIRYRDGLKEAVGHAGYEFQIGIATPLLDPTSEGLTTDAEAEELWKVEEALDDVLSSNDEAVFALTITTGGMREFVFYAAEWKPEYYENKVKEVNKQFSNRDLQFMMKHDKNWDTFRSFTK